VTTETWLGITKLELAVPDEADEEAPPQPTTNQIEKIIKQQRITGFI
jgi:hypothetical protein